MVLIILGTRVIRQSMKILQACSNYPFTNLAIWGLPFFLEYLVYKVACPVWTNLFRRVNVTTAIDTNLCK